jgi:hypothetical protein
VEANGESSDKLFACNLGLPTSPSLVIPKPAINSPTTPIKAKFDTSPDAKKFSPLLNFGKYT